MRANLFNQYIGDCWSRPIWLRSCNFGRREFRIGGPLAYVGRDDLLARGRNFIELFGITGEADQKKTDLRIRIALHGINLYRIGETLFLPETSTQALRKNEGGQFHCDGILVFASGNPPMTEGVGPSASIGAEPRGCWRDERCLLQVPHLFPARSTRLWEDPSRGIRTPKVLPPKVRGAPFRRRPWQPAHR
jgi:hypothetical protein